MNQSKFSLADLFTVLGAVGFGFFCFLGFNFFTLGETVPSLIWALLITLVLGGLAFGAKLLKRTNRNFKKCIIGEWILLFFFLVTAVVFAVFPFSPFSHFFAVSQQKSTIQKQLIENIRQAENLYPEYVTYANNRLNIYEDELKSVVACKIVNPTEYKNYRFVNDVAYTTQVNNKLGDLRKLLFPSNFDDMKKANGDWLSKSQSTIINWKPIGVVSVINDVQPNIDAWAKQLIDFSTFRAVGEKTAENFKYELSFKNVTDIFKTIGRPAPISIPIAIGFYALMLLSYFITKRDSRCPGFKMIFGTKDTLNNEL